METHTALGMSDVILSHFVALQEENATMRMQVDRQTRDLDRQEDRMNAQEERLHAQDQLLRSLRHEMRKVKDELEARPLADAGTENGGPQP